MKESTVTVRDGLFDIKLRTDGSGEPLLFLHGAGGLRGWDPFLADLAGRYTVYAPAHPGFESSSGLEHVDDVLDLVVYYNDLLDALNIESMHVVGHSMGGMIAAELAALSPHRVRRLVLANPVGLWLENHPVADFFAMTPDQLGIALWHDPQSEVAQAMMAVPEDEQAQLQALPGAHAAPGDGRQVPVADSGQGPEETHPPRQGAHPHPLGSIGRAGTGGLCTGIPEGYRRFAGFDHGALRPHAHVRKSPPASSPKSAAS